MTHSPFQFKMRAKIWLYPGMAAWHFLTLPKEEAIAIKLRYGPSERGFGSIPVTITIGNSTWRSSIFPDKKSGSYLLPLKAAIRKKERLQLGDEVDFMVSMSIG